MFRHCLHGIFKNFQISESPPQIPPLTLEAQASSYCIRLDTQQHALAVGSDLDTSILCHQQPSKTSLDDQCLISNLQGRLQCSVV